MTTKSSALKIGAVFSGKPKTMGHERLLAFSGGRFALNGWPRRNIHTDIDVANRTGLSTLAVSGVQVQGHIAQLMIELFGEQWLSNGTMKVKFLRPIDVLETITPYATLVSKSAIDGDDVYEFEIVVKNAAGAESVVGVTTGRLSTT
jgi:acyl dehydratase